MKHCVIPLALQTTYNNITNTPKKILAAIATLSVTIHYTIQVVVLYAYIPITKTIFFAATV